MRIAFIFFTCLLSSGLFAQSSDLLFYMDVGRFHAVRQGQFQHAVELNFLVDENSIRKQLGVDGKYRGEVALSWVLRKQGDSSFVRSYAEDLNWESPMNAEDSARLDVTYQLFHSQIIQLEEGIYNIEASARDKKMPQGKPVRSSRMIILDPIPEREVFFSDLKWLRNTQDRGAGRRAGFRGRSVQVQVNNDVFVNQAYIIAFQDWNNLDKIQNRNGAFFFRYQILLNNNVIQEREKSISSLGRVRNREGTASFTERIDISQYKTNTYYLEVQLLQEQNGTKVPIKTYRRRFYIENTRSALQLDNLSLNNRDADIFNNYNERELDYYLKTLSLLATEQERNYMRVLISYEQKKNYLYRYFDKRRRNPDRETVAHLWRGHLMALKYVNDHYTSTLHEGWETDRGRVFMTYGIPSKVESIAGNLSVLPHKIWTYDRLGVQKQVIFVFYDPDSKLGPGRATNEYPLLHSSKYGEYNNRSWQAQLTVN
ncbi:MAG: GWxTD domain-containing protein [Bacteroidota bacterium]